MQMTVNVVLQVLAGPLTGKRIEVKAGRTLTIGRNAKSEIVLGEDEYLSGRHFSVACDGTICMLRDEQSANGTIVNGRRVSEITLYHGDTIEAGQSKFAVEFNAKTVGHRSTVVEGVHPAQQFQKEVTKQIVQACGRSHLFVFSHPSVALMTLLSGRNLKALYDHKQGPQESYLVQMEEPFEQLPLIVQEAWGKRMAVFVTADEPFESVYKHLHAIGLARAGNGNALRLRFHDPWLLQIFLDSCSHDELKHFLGPVRAFLCEDLSRSANVLEYSLGPAGLRRAVLRINTEVAALAARR